MSPSTPISLLQCRPGSSATRAGSRSWKTRLLSSCANSTRKLTGSRTGTGGLPREDDFIMGTKHSQSYMQIEAELAHHGIRNINDGSGRRRWEATCGYCGKSSDFFRSDFIDAAQIINHFGRQLWVMARNRSPYCSRECAKAARIEKEQKEQKTMASPIAPPKPNGAGPNPIIMVRVITLLNDQFDKDKRLYRNGYTDERVAKETEASPEFVIKLR